MLHLKETDLTTDDLVMIQVRVGEHNLADDLGFEWESRLAGTWIQRSKYDGKIQSVTGVGVLFDTDTVDQRPNGFLYDSLYSLTLRHTYLSRD